MRIPVQTDVSTSKLRHLAAMLGNALGCTRIVHLTCDITLVQLGETLCKRMSGQYVLVYIAYSGPDECLAAEIVLESRGVSDSVIQLALAHTDETILG